MTRISLLLAVVLILPAGAAIAQSAAPTAEHPLGAHPAVIVAARGPAVPSSDADSYILGHPASPTTRGGDVVFAGDRPPVYPAAGTRRP